MQWIRRMLWLAVGVLALAGIAAAVVFLPFGSRLERISAASDRGFYADYFLYISPAAARTAKQASPVTILVQPNNSGTNSDDPAVHQSDAWWTTFGRKPVADELGVILMVPAFVRPGEDWHIYTHALDRDTLTTPRQDLARLDLQLIAMIDDARKRLAARGIATQEKFLIQGFSASGMFANRFTALHPKRVLAAASGSPGGWPIAPLAEFAGEPLPYPAGIADLAALVGRPFDAAAFAQVPQLVYMGSLDDNDSLDFGDGWDKEPAALVDQHFGADPQARWSKSQELYRAVGPSTQFLLVEGIGHDRRALQRYVTDFFHEVLTAH